MAPDVLVEHLSCKLRSRGRCQPGTASIGERARSYRPTFHDIRGQPGPNLQGQRGSSALPFPPVYRGPGAMVGWIVRVEECPRGKLPGAYEEQALAAPTWKQPRPPTMER